MSNKELWLETDFVDAKGGTDLCWYNEGNAREFPFFLTQLWDRITRVTKAKKKFIIRYGKININFVI